MTISVLLAPLGSFIQRLWRIWKSFCVNVFRALMVCVDFKRLPIQVTTPGLQGINNCDKLQIVSEVIFFMNFQLSGLISYDPPVLYQNTIQTLVGCAIVYRIFACSIWQSQYWCSRQSLFEFCKTSFTFLVLLKLDIFLRESCQGSMALENSSTNLQ